jgi:hypothetical protein
MQVKFRLLHKKERCAVEPPLVRQSSDLNSYREQLSDARADIWEAYKIPAPRSRPPVTEKHLSHLGLRVRVSQLNSVANASTVQKLVGAHESVDMIE